VRRWPPVGAGITHDHRGGRVVGRARIAVVASDSTSSARVQRHRARVARRCAIAATRAGFSLGEPRASAV
jgi:hypothetical protein